MFISLRPSTYIMGVKCQHGVIWGHRDQKVIFRKMLLLLQNTWHYFLCVTLCIHVTHTSALA